MRPMRGIVRLFGVVALLCVLGAEPASQPSSGEQGMGLLKQMIGGEWTIDAKWSDGTPLKGRETFEAGAGGRFVYCRTYANRPDGTEYLRYSTMFGIKDGQLTAWAFSYDGSAEETAMQVEGNTLWIKREIKTATGKATLKQAICLVDDDHFTWKVWLDPGGSVTQVMDGTWVRRPK